MGIRWTDSAAKHGIAPEDALHAITHAIYAETEFDDPRGPASVRPTLFIGPSRTGQLLEVMVEEGRRDVTIFHVLVARRKHLDRIGDL